MRHTGWTALAAMALWLAAPDRANANDTKEKTMDSDSSQSKLDAPWKTCPIPTDEELRRTLTPEQYEVMRNSGTEAPFRNAYWDNHRAGLYVDVVTGEPLFSSTDKYDSGTGWPSFTKPVHPEGLTALTDRSHGMARTEVRSVRSNSHLGHLFDDGPGPTKARYCINSAAMRFIPVERLEAEGYGEYLKLFRSEE